MVEIRYDDRPASKSDWTLEDDVAHGLPGHKGVRCGTCAQHSTTIVRLQPTLADYWQTKQIEWQEACDVVFRAFDDSVAAHFPEHVPGAKNCGCPTKPKLPQKPQMPYERLHI